MSINAYVEKYADLMEMAEKYIWENPEVGYKEFKTNEFMIREFEKLGYKVEQFDGITGFTAYYDTGKKGATVLVLAELDSLICYQHPDCDKETGAVHNCGHNTQCAAALGVAAAIREKAVNEKLSGKIKFAVVPAEEGIEISYRQKLIEDGVISFTSGKPECIKRGMLNDVDVAFMVHGTNLSERGATYRFEIGSNGVVRKKITFIGRAAHAGGFPWDGINALYAAEIAMAACNALRETFKECDYIRFHPIITKGGDAVNAIPERVVMESYVRGASPKAIKDANKKINRAITGAALALGAEVKIDDGAGSSPLFDDENLTELMHEAARELVGEEKIYMRPDWETSSTDMGDVSCLVPSVHAYVNSYLGLAHGKDYKRIDPRKACLDSALLQVNTLVKLMENGCQRAYEIKDKYEKKYSSVEEYLKEISALSSSYSPIKYEDGRAEVKL